MATYQHILSHVCTCQHITRHQEKVVWCINVQSPAQAESCQTSAQHRCQNITWRTLSRKTSLDLFINPDLIYLYSIVSLTADFSLPVLLFGWFGRKLWALARSNNLYAFWHFEYERHFSKIQHLSTFLTEMPAKHDRWTNKRLVNRLRREQNLSIRASLTYSKLFTLSDPPSATFCYFFLFVPGKTTRNN